VELDPLEPEAAWAFDAACALDPLASDPALAEAGCEERDVL
jgi:hypothetical protein